MPDITTQRIQLGTAIVLLAAIISPIVFYNLKIQKVEMDSISHEKQIQEDRARIKDLEDRARQADIEYAEIKTKLVSIETTLLEIKQSLKKRD